MTFGFKWESYAEPLFFSFPCPYVLIPPVLVLPQAHLRQALPSLPPFLIKQGWPPAGSGSHSAPSSLSLTIVASLNCSSPPRNLNPSFVVSACFPLHFLPQSTGITEGCYVSSSGWLALTVCDLFRRTWLGQHVFCAPVDCRNCLINLIPTCTHAVYFSILLWSPTECAASFTHRCLHTCCSFWLKYPSLLFSLTRSSSESG